MTTSLWLQRRKASGVEVEGPLAGVAKGYVATGRGGGGHDRRCGNVSAAGGVDAGEQGLNHTPSLQIVRNLKRLHFWSLKCIVIN